MAEGFDLTITIAALLAAASFFNACYNAAVGPTGGAMIASFAAILPPQLALMMQAIGNVIGGTTRTITFFKHIERRPFIILMAGMVVGCVLAMPAFKYIPEWLLQLVLATIVLLITWLPKPTVDKKPHEAGLFIASVVGSTLSVFFAMGMLGMAAVCERYFANRERFLAHVNAWALVQNLIKIIWFSTFIAIDDRVALVLTGVIFVSMMAGHFTGLAIAGRVPEAYLRKALKLTITVFAVILFAKGLLHFT